MSSSDRIDRALAADGEEIGGGFGKYEAHGAYHWGWADPDSPSYAPAAQARYQLIAEQVEAVDRVLDVGCGDGFLLSLVGRRAGRAVGVDSERSGVFLARRKLAAVTNCEVLVATGAGLPFPDGTFDVVVLAEVIEHLEAPGAVLREIRRVLRPGGRVVVTTPRRLPDHWWDRKHHVTEYGSSELRALLSDHFPSVRMTHFLSLRWWWIRKRLGKVFIRLWSRYLYNPFLASGPEPDGYGHLLAVASLDC